MIGKRWWRADMDEKCPEVPIREGPAQQPVTFDHAMNDGHSTDRPNDAMQHVKNRVR